MQGVLSVSMYPHTTAFPGAPEEDGEDRISGTVVRGSRTWSYAVVPEREGTWRLDVPGIPYFDPADQRYETAAAPPTW